MVNKILYIPDERYMRLGEVGKAMRMRDPKIKKKEMLAKAINRSIELGLPILEKEFGIQLAGT